MPCWRSCCSAWASELAWAVGTRAVKKFAKLPGSTCQPRAVHSACCACNAVLEVLADNGVVRPVMRFGLPDEFIEQGTQAELLEDVGLTSEAIESKVAERIAKLGI